MGPSLWEPSGGLLPLVMEPPGRRRPVVPLQQVRVVLHTLAVGGN